jgi:uncharacterized protein involved in exopolysaccharide biosynthesis
MQDQDNQTASARQAQMDDDEINLMDLLLVIAKHNRFIIKLTGSAALLAVVMALLMDNVYTAKTVILPPQQGASSASMVLGQLGGLAGLAGAAGLKNPNDLHIGMLKSRSVADSLIARFKLQQKFEAKTMDDTRKLLANGTDITAGKDGLINIEYSDKDPQFAATVANAYVDELDRFNSTLAVTEASQKRLFFEKQLKSTRDNLALAETGLKQSQEKSGLILPEKQGAAIIEAAATLRAQVAAKEVELQAMRAFATPQNPDYQRLQEVLIGLRVQLAKVERNSVQGKGDVMVPTGKLAETGLEYMRKMRELKYQETLFDLLSKQFEIAKIEEAKEAALIQVVDKALPPDKKSKPKRALIVILVTLMAFFIGVLLAFFREAKERASQDPASAERMHLLRRYLRRGA